MRSDPLFSALICRKPTLFDGNQWPEYKIMADGKGVNVSYVDLNPYLNNYSQSIQLNGYRGQDGFTPSVINNCLEFWSDILVSKSESNSSNSMKSVQNSMKHLLIIILLIKLFLF